MPNQLLHKGIFINSLKAIKPCLKIGYWAFWMLSKLVKEMKTMIPDLTTMSENNEESS